MQKILGLAVAALCGVVALPAFALETGQCLPATQVRATLAAEGQNPILVGNRSGYGYPTALIFTSNVDGTKGYAIRGDKPFGEQSETVCIDSVYHDIRLNDISKPGIPAWAKMGGNAKTAESVCKRDKLGYQESCQLRDVTLANLETRGVHVMMQATGTAINPRDKTIRTKQLLFVGVGPSDNKGIFEAATHEGASYMLSAYTGVSYTQFGDAMLRKK